MLQDKSNMRKYFPKILLKYLGFYKIVFNIDRTLEDRKIEIGDDVHQINKSENPLNETANICFKGCSLSVAFK